MACMPINDIATQPRLLSNGLRSNKKHTHRHHGIKCSPLAACCARRLRVSVLAELSNLVLHHGLPLPRLAAEQADLPDNVGRVGVKVYPDELQCASMNADYVDVDVDVHQMVSRSCKRAERFPKKPPIFTRVMQGSGDGGGGGGWGGAEVFQSIRDFQQVPYR